MLKFYCHAKIIVKVLRIILLTNNIELFTTWVHTPINALQIDSKTSSDDSKDDYDSAGVLNILKEKKNDVNKTFEIINGNSDILFSHSIIDFRSGVGDDYNKSEPHFIDVGDTFRTICRIQTMIASFNNSNIIYNNDSIGYELTYNTQIYNTPCRLTTYKQKNIIYNVDDTSNIITTTTAPVNTYDKSKYTDEEISEYEDFDEQMKQFKIKYLKFNEKINATHDSDMQFILGQFMSNMGFMHCDLIDFDVHYKHLNAKYYFDYFDISVSYINQQFRLILLPTFITQVRDLILETSNIQGCQEDVVFIYTLPCRNYEAKVVQYVPMLRVINIVYNIDKLMSVYGPYYGTYNFIKSKILQVMNVNYFNESQTDGISIFIFQQGVNEVSRVSIVGYNSQYGGVQTFHIRLFVKMVQSKLNMKRENICLRHIKPVF